MSAALWIDPTFGCSGDMLLGALLAVHASAAHAGVAESGTVQLTDQSGTDQSGVRQAPSDVVDELLGELRAALAPVVGQPARGAQPLATASADAHDTPGADASGGWSITVSNVVRNGISALRANVEAPELAHRAWSSIDALLAGSALPAAVVDGARCTFRRLAEVEAEQHRVDIDQVHFHEVGAVDAVVDIVGVWWLVDRLGVTEVCSGPVGIGHGTVRAAHGLLPLPAPATAALLVGAPTHPLDAPFETCTPTGAALLATLGTWGPLPAGTLSAVGRGAGGKDPAGHPNVVSALLVERPTSPRSGARQPADDWSVNTALLLSTNVDDVSAETLGYVIDAALAAGADDAWVTPIVMKKSRPAHQLNVLVDAEHAAALRDLIVAETGTLGVRVSDVAKHVAPRRIDVVRVHDTEVRIKVGPHRAKPEHDDVAEVARRLGRPLRDIVDDALQVWRSQQP